MSNKVVGPFLAFHGHEPASKEWRGSVLMLVHTSLGSGSPVLHLKDGQAAATVEGQLQDTYQGWNFWRLDILIVSSSTQRQVEYWVTVPGQPDTQHFSFYVAGTDQAWNWAFFTCNGFHDPNNEKEAGGITHLWQDVLERHKQRPFHLMVGGGDQLYCDSVWKVPALAAWCEDLDRKDRWQDSFSQDMESQANDSYFNQYLQHWQKAGFREALATIPMVMTFDDHDIFDGWGSYPYYLQECPVWQLHSHKDKVTSQNGAFGFKGWTWVSCLGPSVALVMLDCRSERTQKQVVLKESYSMLQAKLLALPDTVKHIVFVATIPLIYPEIRAAEEVFECISCTSVRAAKVVDLQHLAQKSGLVKDLVSQFGTADLLDDIQDHWGSDLRRKEKVQLVHLLQAVAAAKGARVTLLGGDVHLCCAGRFESVRGLPPDKDPRYIVQLTSSAIGNVPPPAGVVEVLAHSKDSWMLDQETKEFMIEGIFGPGKKLMPNRNWLTGQLQADALHFQFHVEADGWTSMRPDEFKVVVPPLNTGKHPGGPMPFAVVPAPPSRYASIAARLE